MPSRGKKVQFANFVGPSYPAKSPFVSISDAINLYPEKLPIPGKSLYNYYNTPGKTLEVTLGLGPVRCAYTPAIADVQGFPNRSYFVAGEDNVAITPTSVHLYAIDYSIGLGPTVIDFGSLDITGAGSFPIPWQIVANGPQLLIFGGITNAGNILNISAGTLTRITAPGWLGASSVAFLDGYFIAVEPYTQKFFISGYQDGLSWDALDFAIENDVPDQILAVAQDHRRIWFFGGTRVEGYYDSGAADFPFVRDQSAVVQTGIVAPMSLATIDNTLFWLGQDQNGGNAAYRLNGITAERISTYAQEAAWNGFEQTKDAVAFAYQENGHTFYQICFPSAGGPAFVYDVGEKQWHKRGYWSQNTAEYIEPLGRYHTYNPGINAHLVAGGALDASGNVYRMSQDLYTDDSIPIRRLRRTGYISDTQNRIFCSRFELQMETGTTQLLDGDGNPREAQITMRYSDDGRNWGPEVLKDCGALGDYQKIVYWLRQGSFYQRAYEIVYIEPTPVAITNAFLELTEAS